MGKFEKKAMMVLAWLVGIVLFFISLLLLSIWLGFLWACFIESALAIGLVIVVHDKLKKLTCNELFGGTVLVVICFCIIVGIAAGGSWLIE